MKSIRYRLGAMIALATVGLVVALGLRPASTQRIVSAYAIAIAALVALAYTRIARDATEPRPPSIFEHALEAPDSGRARPGELVRIERDITLGERNAGYLHSRLLPMLREAAARVLANHNVELERGHALLGDDAWALLDPNRPEPRDQYAPGLPLRKIRQLVETIEQL